jgi:hypothetical protein
MNVKPDPLPSVADLIERVGDVPIRVWPPLANSGRALWHDGVLLVSQAVFNRIAAAANHEERAAVLRGVPYIDTAGVKDGDHVPLWPPPGGTPGSNGPAVVGRRPSGAASSRFGRWHTPGRRGAGRRPLSTHRRQTLPPAWPVHGGEFLAWLLAGPRQELRIGHSRHAALTRPAPFDPPAPSQDAQDSPIPHSPQRFAILALAPEVKNYAAVDTIFLAF